MNGRIEDEIRRLESRFRVEYREEGNWILIWQYPVDLGLWDADQVDIAFRVPDGYPGVKPYGFYVRPRIRLESGETPASSTEANEPPFGGEWLKFSWDCPDWRATADAGSGDNLLNWALTFARRLEEGT